MGKQDVNEVRLSGTAGDDVKFGRAITGKEYCTFSLCVVPYNKKHGDNEDEMSRSVNYIRIIVFNNRHTRNVDYLRSMNFHRGQRVSVFGWLSSRKTEIKGNNIIQLSVVVRKIEIAQTNNKENERKKEGLFISTY